ncbi:MAG: hypothetical protein AB7E79_17005 [Rhodospirillaceae bacterium]
MKIGSAALAAFLTFGATAASAADLDTVRTALTPLRQSTTDPASRMPREFLTVRDSLRDWIETRLAGFPQFGDAAAFAKTLNAEIAAKDLACIDGKEPGYNRCASPRELDARGFLGLVEVARVQDLLIVQAETGIPCGFDETAYVYEWVNDGWRRLVDTSQAAAGGPYLAEQIEQVLFVQPDGMPRDALLLAVTGATPSCADQYRPVHYRVWSAKRGTGSSLVVDGREGDADVARRSPAVSARFEDGDLLLEMDLRSFDPSRRSRVAVRRFNFDKPQAARVAPLALSPRDFVEEWLRSSWSAAATWTSPAARGALAPVHASAHQNLSRARFSGATLRCAGDSAVQVGVRFADGERFFRVKHDPAGAYVMLAADSAPADTCARPDASLDSPRTLF